MSYESKMLSKLAMPTRELVEHVLLRTLLKHGGVIKEFSSAEETVTGMADDLALSKPQRSAFLETIYRKENRLKKARLWHRLLFRAADALSHQRFVSSPTQTSQLTGRREWMLTEKGFDEALRLCNIPETEKESLSIKSYEVQKVVNKLVESPKPKDYDPIDKTKRIATVTTESALRGRGFRQAVIEAYECRCAVCGLKISSPDALFWEVEAAHIVPNRALGRDDVWNGIAMCHLHHWAFDVGWFALLDDYRIEISSQIQLLPSDFGKMGNYEVIGSLGKQATPILLPTRAEFRPDCNAVRWHREHVFGRRCAVLEEKPYEETETKENHLFDKC
jgi:hypothetical protein